MATQYAFGQIVTSGLVLSLNAADRNSYPGSGTEWTDMSGNGNNGTLINGPTFSSVNGGAIVFDDIDDYVSCGTINMPSSAQTIEVTFLWGSVGTSNIDFLFSGNLEQLEVHLGSSLNNLRYIPAGFPNGYVDAPNFVTAGVNIVTCTYDGSTFPKIYKNGSLVATASTLPTVSSSGSQTVRLGYRSNSTFPFKGNIYSARLYNRALSVAEIQQNYDAQKSRYGL